MDPIKGTTTTHTADPRAKAIARTLARELRRHPQRWTQGAQARTADGRPTDPRAPGCACWCLMGFIIRESPHEGDVDDAVLSAFELAAVGAPYTGGPQCVQFVSWQDRKSRSVLDIIAVCDAVAAA